MPLLLFFQIALHFLVSPGAKFKSTNKIEGGVENTGNVRVSM